MWILRIIDVILTKTALLLIILYKKILSPYLGKSCRFVPTCSEYAMVSYQRLGFILGSFYTAKRLIKCHPFGSFGEDLPPVVKDVKQKNKD